MNPLLQLIEHGQSYWLDDLTRTMIENGELARRVEKDGLRGITSNPAIFRHAISGSGIYNSQIEALVGEGRPVGEIYEALVVRDIQNACDVLRPVYDASDGVDGFVSLEVSPYLAHDTEGSIAEARRLFAAVDRPNVFIKIPGSPAGVPAIESLLYEGINVNVTLLFSIDAYESIAKAYIRALEHRLKDGRPIDGVASVASFFLSRIDVLVDALLAQRILPGPRATDPRPESLLGAAAVASARLAYQRFGRIFRGASWDALAAEGARVQRLLWASTSTKNPLYPDVKYVEPLIGPHTVNTMPEQTIAAFADHGVVADTIAEGVDDAERVFRDLDSLGIDMAQVTAQLLEEGVRKFIDPYDDLMAALADERSRTLGHHAAHQTVQANSTAGPLDAALGALDEIQFGRRVAARDASLWSGDPDRQASIADRLGWLEAPEHFAAKIEELTAFAGDVRRAGFTHVVHMGMGGSSLCPEVCRRVFGSAKGFPELIVLDDTDPGAVRQVDARIDPARTLFIVASKSGTTDETISFYRYFHDRVAAAGVDDPGTHFVAITDPGTPLVEEAGIKHFRRVFENVADVGGRYSALTYFGLVPMALMGIDLTGLLGSARQMGRSCGPEIPAGKNPAVVLGALLGRCARAGRDKVTIVASPSVAPFGLWAEQLIAESTGKEGRGLLPVEGEPLGDPAVYGDDRVFVHLSVRGDTEDGSARRLDGLAAAGHPVVRIELADRVGLGGEFFRWELATATAGMMLGIDAFDQPNVAESKKNTRELLEGWKKAKAFDEGAPVAKSDGISVYADADGSWLGDAGRKSAGAVLAALIDSVHAGDYVALLAYFQGTPLREHALADLRRGLRDRLRVATTVGYGPRYLHSTGQLHKGGPDTGVFVLLTGGSGDDLDIPERGFGFATLHRAQALGDYRSLVAHGRRVVRVDLGKDTDKGLARLADLLA